MQSYSWNKKAQCSTLQSYSRLQSVSVSYLSENSAVFACWISANFTTCHTQPGSLSHALRCLEGLFSFTQTGGLRLPSFVRLTSFLSRGPQKKSTTFFRGSVRGLSSGGGRSIVVSAWRKIGSKQRPFWLFGRIHESKELLYEGFGTCEGCTSENG